ncbi:uncharacterized protein BXZ73DRAFT_88203 [Epithele typhae]|uniref:uncharacterized protein n=1 Tax=Epithele typhae TaxID=378194 RepID=UPI002007246C|nr:uncharacterized protein BXZ73DRAFT_88203 [Epithele typhae]KAH9941779.1 hypothetical protein BXZ73DRAFT_88203 [Epithele typhae]
MLRAAKNGSTTRLSRSIARPRPPKVPRLTIPHAQWSKSYATSSESSTGSPGLRMRVSTLFTILLGVGIAATSYGIYDFYATFTMWPKEVREDLRAGIKAKHQGELDLSERYLRRAWQTARELPITAFSQEPYLKLSGIAIVLAEVLESTNRPEQAYETYSTALALLRAAEAQPQTQLSGRERMRTVALAHKLGEMAEVYQREPEEVEHFLTFAVEEALRMLKDAGGVDVKGKQKAGAGEDATVMLAELEMPWWVRKVDVAAPLEALGRFYARENKPQYATTLYLQTVGLLMQPSPGEKEANVEDRCRAAQVMNNLSDIMSRGPPPSNIHNAEAWARKAQDVIEKTRTMSGARRNPEAMMLCEQTYAAVLFNLGALLEMSGQLEDAKKSFEETVAHSKKIGLRTGLMEARAALRRVERAQTRTGRESRSTT